jgi:hypothetical protein
MVVSTRVSKARKLLNTKLELFATIGGIVEFPGGLDKYARAVQMMGFFFGGGSRLGQRVDDDDSIDRRECALMEIVVSDRRRELDICSREAMRGKRVSV